MLLLFEIFYFSVVYRYPIITDRSRSPGSSAILSASFINSYADDAFLYVRRSADILEHPCISEMAFYRIFPDVANSPVHLQRGISYLVHPTAYRRACAEAIRLSFPQTHAEKAQLTCHPNNIRQSGGVVFFAFPCDLFGSSANTPADSRIIS